MQLYTAQQIRDQEARWSKRCGLPTFELMQRAGRATLLHIRYHFPSARSIVIVCGCGNNAGDGYQLGALALQEGLTVTLLQVGKAPSPTSDAAFAIDNFLKAGGKALNYQSQLLKQADLIVDALLGSGIQGHVREPFIQPIHDINAAQAPVLAVDIPSGLCADSGEIAGVSVEATHSLSFIGCKQGMVAADAKDCCGEIYINDLGVTIERDSSDQVTATQSWQGLRHLLKRRKHNSHKASFGRLLCIGGNQSMGGAIVMASAAALRTGAGYVYTFCHPNHYPTIHTTVPEALTVLDFEQLEQVIPQLDAIVIGPGLGQDIWAQRSLTLALHSGKPLIIDADALNLIAAYDLDCPKGTLLTPHPGEAKRLLADSWPNGDRFKQINALAAKFPGCSILLKGAGSLMTDGGQIRVEEGGNPGMASAGMGDVLAGMAGAFVAQGYHPLLALQLATALHAYIGDELAKSGQIGLLASDIINNIRFYLR